MKADQLQTQQVPHERVLGCSSGGVGVFKNLHKPVASLKTEWPKGKAECTVITPVFPEGCVCPLITAGEDKLQGKRSIY